jgi:hypothetical protein
MFKSERAMTWSLGAGAIWSTSLVATRFPAIP